MTWQRGSIVSVLFLTLVLSVSAVDYSDVDCGWTGINEQQCINKGCVWLPNFPGPWCQKQGSPYIPSALDLGFDHMTDDQKIIFNYSALSLVVLSLAVLTATSQAYLSRDLVVLGILLVLAVITRYHDLENPKEIVFDEYYFGDFANSYCNGIYVFDIHPPLAKLTHYLAGTALGHKCTKNFHDNEELVKYTDLDEYIHYREVSALFGTLAVPLAYLIGRRFGLSMESSIVLGALVLCDPLLLSETRLVLTDSQLFFYIILSIYCAQRLWDTQSRSWGRNFWTVATAVAAGCAFGVKFTALATLAWIAFATYVSVFTAQSPVSLFRCAVAAVIAAVVFIIPFWFHIELGKKSGELDWNIDHAHQRLLIGNENYDSNAVAPSFPEHLVYLIRRMLEQNAASLGEHPYASYWYEWIVGGGALLSYSEHKEEEDWHGHVFITSSVYICYSILVAIGAFVPVALTLLRSRSQVPLSGREVHFIKLGFLFLLGWVANLLPYALVERTTYSYHHLPAQFFGMLTICLVFDYFPYLFLSLFYKGKQLDSLLHKLRSIVAILFMCGLFYHFWYYSCFSYGYGLSSVEFAKRKWAVSAV